MFANGLEQKYVLFQVYDLVGLTELYYAGSHGMDIIFPAKGMVSERHVNCVKSTDLEVFI